MGECRKSGDDNITTDPQRQARERMYETALHQGEDLPFFDVIEIIQEDRYYRHMESTQECLRLACDMYTACGFALPPEVEDAMQDGEAFRDLALELF